MGAYDVTAFRNRDSLKKAAVASMASDTTTVTTVNNTLFLLDALSL